MNDSSLGSAWIPIGIAIVMFAAFVGFIILGFVRFMQERRKQQELRSSPRGHFVFARIMDHILPMERGAKYEKPLQEALVARRLGVVTGGGIQMSRDGSSVEWVGIDIDLANLDGALNFTRETLRQLGAPAGSILEYRVGDQKKMVEIA